MKKLTLLALLLGLLTGCGAAKEATALPAAMPRILRSGMKTGSMQTR